MNELARRLKDVVDHRFNGVARRASLAAGVNENAVLKVLENPHHQSTLETLDKMATAYGWDVRDVVCWALDRPVPPLTEGEPIAVIARILAHAGYSETHRAFILDMIRRAAPARVPSNESS